MGVTRRYRIPARMCVTCHYENFPYETIMGAHIRTHTRTRLLQWSYGLAQVLLKTDTRVAYSPLKATYKGAFPRLISVNYDSLNYTRTIAG